MVDTYMTYIRNPLGAKYVPHVEIRTLWVGHNYTGPPSKVWGPKFYLDSTLRTPPFRDVLSRFVQYEFFQVKVPGRPDRD